MPSRVGGRSERNQIIRGRPGWFVADIGGLGSACGLLTGGAEWRDRWTARCLVVGGDGKRKAGGGAGRAWARRGRRRSRLAAEERARKEGASRGWIRFAGWLGRHGKFGGNRRVIWAGTKIFAKE
jgi:hypothetical protein